MATVSLGNDIPGFTFVQVCRIDDTSAVIRMVYQGGNCETTAGLEPRVELNSTGAMVIIPSTATAEICIKQVVPNNVQKTIGIAPETAQLDITLLDPQLEAQGKQTVTIEPNSADCPLPGQGGF